MNERLKTIIGSILVALTVMSWGTLVTGFWMGSAWVINLIIPSKPGTDFFTFHEIFLFGYGIILGAVSLFMTARLYGKTVYFKDIQSCSDTPTEGEK